MRITSLFKKIAAAKTRFVINQGGTSSSKTWSTLQLLYARALKYDGLHISVVAETLPALKRGALRDFIKMLQEEGTYSEDFHNKSENTFYFGKSSIEFFSADIEGKVRGARRDLLFLNECNNISYETFTQLQIRTKKQIFMDYNPSSAFWVHDKILSLPSEQFTFIKSTYKDNDLLDDNIVRAIEAKRGDKEWFKVFGEGELGSHEGLIFNNWKMIDAFPKDTKWTVYGLDWGFTHDPSAVIKVGLSDGELFLEEIMYDTNLTNSDIAARIPHLKNEMIVCDSAEPKSIEDLKRLGFRVQGAVKGPDSVRKGIDMIKTYKMNVVNTSTNLIKELRNYQWKKNKDGGYENTPIDSFNHLIDPLRYVLMAKGSTSSFRAKVF